MKELDKQYDPKTVDPRWYDIGQKKGYFHGDAAKGGTPYCVVIPPPNVTGILHIGHALNNTIQDILVRWQRMEGKNTVWLPGTDHAGMAVRSSGNLSGWVPPAIGNANVLRWMPG